MNSAILTAKLLALVEGKETPESWLSWWSDHESQLETLLSRGEFLRLKPCKHAFKWVPLLSSQKGAAGILACLLQVLRQTNRIRQPKIAGNRLESVRYLQAG